MLQRAIERLLTIVGEASRHVAPLTRAMIEQPWDDIIRFRDKEIHGYDGLPPHRVFSVATEHLPPLCAAVERHLQR